MLGDTVSGNCMKPGLRSPVESWPSTGDFSVPQFPHVQTKVGNVFISKTMIVRFSWLILVSLWMWGLAG